MQLFCLFFSFAGYLFCVPLILQVAINHLLSTVTFTERQVVESA